MDTKNTNNSASNLPVKYRYIPEVGQHVKLRTFEDYSARGLSIWAHMLVLDVLPLNGNESDDFFNVIELEELNGSVPTGKTVRVPLSAIQKPIGWREVYDIHVSPEQLEALLSWLPRGLAVRQSNYIGDGSTQYHPLDTDGACHWKYGTLTDKVSPEQVKDRIRIVKVEFVYDAFVMRECRYCHGAGHREYPLNQGDKPCHVCNATGKAPKYFSEFDKKERKTVLAELNKEGFKVQWEKRGQHWSMERETLVKDAGQDFQNDNAYGDPDAKCTCQNELHRDHESGQCENDPTEQVLTDGGRVPMCKECADFDVDGGRKDGAQ